MAAVITKALWGTTYDGLPGNGVANVTAEAISKYKNGKGTRTFKASHEFWGVDPAENHRKAMVIEWNDEKGQSHFGLCPEGGSFDLPS